jgi:YbbR domain-containing protein
MPIISLNRVERRRFSVFLSCLLLAVFLWLCFALSKDYDYKVTSKLNYINPPLNKAYHPLQDDTVSLNVRGSGWQLVFAKLKLRSKVIDVDLKALESANYITISKQLLQINRQFKSNQKVVSVGPDTLFFDFTRRITKRVPVKLMYKLSFLKPFGVSGPIRLEPAMVMVTGAAEDLKEISSWRTDSLLLSDVNESINTKISFQKGAKNNVDVFPKFVKVLIPIDEFTEKVIEIPVNIVNNPGDDVKIVPEKVKITMLTALSNYPKVERDSISATVDLERWMKSRYPQLPIQIKKFPPFSKLLKTDPQVVDFFIKE